MRLRRATEESLSVPTFSGPVDCTPWVIGDLWPTELSADNPETATLTDFLRVDLRRIADSANEELRAIGRAGTGYSARRAAEARVIDEARAMAMRRVDSTIRQVRQLRRPVEQRDSRGPTATRPIDGRADMEATRVLPVVRDGRPAFDMEKTQVIPAVRDVPTEPPAEPKPLVDDRAAPAGRGGEADQRLRRQLSFVARQEPRLTWVIGELQDGTTVLTTDLGHGWIPPGIAIPDGVKLLKPAPRVGGPSDWLDTATRAVSYVPGTSTDWSADFADIASSVEALQLPAIKDLGWELGVATHWREGVPRLVHTLAKAAEAGADVIDQEIDLLRVHLDTARYQVLAQYPEVDVAQLRNCMLLAATEGMVSGDPISANYHFSWFRELDAKSSVQGADSEPDRPTSA